MSGRRLTKDEYWSLMHAQNVVNTRRALLVDGEASQAAMLAKLYKLVPSRTIVRCGLARCKGQKFVFEKATEYPKRRCVNGDWQFYGRPVITGRRIIRKGVLSDKIVELGRTWCATREMWWGK